MVFTCQVLLQVQELHLRSSMDPRSASEFSEICNGKVLFVTTYKIAFSLLTVISYDSVAPTLLLKTRRKRIFKLFSASTAVKIQG